MQVVVEASTSQRADKRVQSLARARGGHSTLALPGLGLARGLSFCFDFGLGCSLGISLSLGHRFNIGLSLDLGHGLGFLFSLSLRLSPGIGFCLGLGVGLGHSLDLWSPSQSWSLPKPPSSSLTQTATHPQ